MAINKQDELTAIIVGFIVEGNTYHDIQEWLSVNYPKSDADKEFKSAKQRIIKEHAHLASMEYEVALAAMRECQRRSMEIGDYKTASAIAEKIIKLTSSRWD